MCVRVEGGLRGEGGGWRGEHCSSGGISSYAAGLGCFRTREGGKMLFSGLEDQLTVCIAGFFTLVDICLVISIKEMGVGG